MPLHYCKRLSSSPLQKRISQTLFVAIFCGLLTGCAAITNPVANGVPVHILPEELLAESKEGFQQIDLALLRQSPPEIYELAPGDTLGIYIEGILGDAETPPPVNIPDSAILPPSIGYPFPIRKDGTVSLPYVGAVQVAAMSIEEAEQAVIDAYLEKEILRLEDRRILVTLMRPRRIQVMVFREDSQQRQLSLRSESLFGLGTTRTTIGGGRQSVGHLVILPAYENDVLNALIRSGGLPGLESTHEVLIRRRQGNEEYVGASPEEIHFSPSSQPCLDGAFGTGAEGEQNVTRIPFRSRPGESITIRPEDILLNDGDIITVQARKPEFFYTGGLIISGEHPLPNDYNLTVLEAVLRTRGPVFNGGFNASNLNGTAISAGIGNPSPSLLAVLRKTANGGQVTIRVDLNEAARNPRENIFVQAGDVLFLQETTDEAVARYLSQVFQINLFGRFLNRQNAQGSASAVLP